MEIEPVLTLRFIYESEMLQYIVFRALDSVIMNHGPLSCI